MGLLAWMSKGNLRRAARNFVDVIDRGESAAVIEDREFRLQKALALSEGVVPDSEVCALIEQVARSSARSKESIVALAAFLDDPVRSELLRSAAGANR